MCAVFTAGSCCPSGRPCSCPWLPTQEVWGGTSGLCSQGPPSTPAAEPKDSEPPRSAFYLA